MRRLSKGFSLVELMIVVAIIGILAAIAIPNFIAMQLKAKRSEVPGNVDGIKTAELGYDAAFDGFLAAAVAPDATPGKSLRDWNNPADFTSLGWKPDGQVRGSYQVTLAGSSADTTNDFLVSASSDVDGDNTDANYTATTSINATLDAADKSNY